MLNLHIMRCFSESAAIGQMKCTGGMQLAYRLVANGFKTGSGLSSGVLVQCVKIVIPRIFQTADGAMFFVTLSCVCKSFVFFFAQSRVKSVFVGFALCLMTYDANANAHTTTS